MSVVWRPIHDTWPVPAEDSARDLSEDEGPSDAGQCDLRPLQVIWEMTRACVWNATATRLAKRLNRGQDGNEFSTVEAFHLIDQVREMRVPVLALTGGDPLLRPDLFPVVEFAARRSVRASLTLLPTPLLDAQVIADLKESGLMRAGFWLHGSTPGQHDACTGVRGSHRRTVEAVASCHEVELPVQINTILGRRNFHDVDPMIEFLTHLDVVLWNVNFFVPSGNEPRDETLDAGQFEAVFEKLYSASKRVHFQIKTTEGQHYLRYCFHRRCRESRRRMKLAEAIRSTAWSARDSRRLVFINHHGEAYPSRFLPVSGGNVIKENLARVYGSSELFVSLRAGSKLKGKCGRCPFRDACGGSRARAYAMTGDLFAEDPCCAYQP